MNPPKRLGSRFSAATRQSMLEQEYDSHLASGDAGYNSTVTRRDTAVSDADRQTLNRLTTSPAEFRTYYQNGDDAKSAGEVYRCTEEGCADWAYNYQVARYSGNTPTTNAKAFAEAQQRIKRLTGMSGNAWQGIGNIVHAGGELLYNRFDPSGKEVGDRQPKMQPGDMVGLYDPIWSESGDHAEEIKRQGKMGAKNSHIGVVARVDPDGKVWVKHNFGTSVRMDALVPNKEGFLEFENNQLGKNYSVSSAARPRTVAATPVEAARRIRQQTRAASVNSNQLVAAGQYTDNPMVGNAVQVLNERKQELISKLGISEQDFEDYARVAVGVLGQESGYDQGNGVRDNRLFRFGKQAVKAATSVVTGDEPSRGPAQIKYLPRTAADFDISEDDLSELNLNVPNTVRQKKSALAAFLLAAEHGQTLKDNPDRLKSPDINYQIAKMHQTPNAHRSVRRAHNLATFEDAYAGNVLQYGIDAVQVVDPQNHPVPSTFGETYLADRAKRQPPRSTFDPRTLTTMSASTTAVRPYVPRFGMGGRLPKKKGGDCGCGRSHAFGGWLKETARTVGDLGHDYGLGVADTAMGLAGMTDVIDSGDYRTGAGRLTDKVMGVTSPIAGMVGATALGVPRP